MDTNFLKDTDADDERLNQFAREQIRRIGKLQRANNTALQGDIGAIWQTRERISNTSNSIHRTLGHCESATTNFRRYAQGRIRQFKQEFREFADGKFQFFQQSSKRDIKSCIAKIGDFISVNRKKLEKVLKIDKKLEMGML